MKHDPAMKLPAFAARWYAAAFALFAFGGLAGLLLVAVAPIREMSLLGLGIVLLSATGFAASALGLGLERPYLLRSIRTRAFDVLRSGSFDVSPFGHRRLEAPRVA